MTRLSRVTVVAPSKNEVANLPAFLRSLPPQPELILCDASTDGTGDLALALRPERTRVLRCEGSIAEARQVGAMHASGDLLVFADVDVSFGPRYFARLLLDRRWDAVYGAKLSRDDFRWYYQSVVVAQWASTLAFGIAGASGSNMAITREAFLSLGGFREDLPCNEDSELFFRAFRRGLRVRFDPSLVVYAHDHRRLRQGRLKKSAHSITRNIVLFALCKRPRLPKFVRGDWGYWSNKRLEPAD